MRRDIYKSNYKKFFFHPYKILLGLSLLSISAMFFGITMAYLYQRFEQHIVPVQLPLIFLANALVLIGSSWTLHQSKKAYEHDDTEGYKQQLLFTLLLTLAFMGLQAYGWYWMQQHGMFPSSGPGVGYLYAIAGLHLFHVFAGLPFFALFLRTAYKRMREPVSVLVYFSDPEKALKLRLLTIYWHYLDGLWVYLVLFFIANQFITI